MVVFDWILGVIWHTWVFRLSNTTIRDLILKGPLEALVSYQYIVIAKLGMDISRIIPLIIICLHRIDITDFRIFLFHNLIL